MLYLIGGDNSYQSTQRLKELKNEFKERFDGNIQILNADEVEDYNRIISSSDSLSLFSKEKLIIIKRLFSSNSSNIEKIQEYLKKSSDMNLIFWEDRSFDKRRGLYKLIKKKGVVEEFERPRYSKLKTWLTNYLREKINFDPECVDELIFKIGDDQMLLASTVKNLVVLILSNKQRKLTLEHIDHFVDKTAEENIWEFIDAIADYDKAKALDIVERLLQERGDFVMVVGMITRQFRILAMVKYLLNLHKNHAEITSTLRLHPFVVRKAVSHCHNFTISQLRKLYSKLVKTDLVVKQGMFSEKLALDLLIAAI
ncbi:DNA polymerase III subunit delta [Patescibacteria group bacterium]